MADGDQKPILMFYSLRNRDGKWLRRKGYRGVGQCWVDDIKDARIYGKLGHARAQVTYWAKNHSQFGIPEIIELPVVSMRALPAEAARVRKVLRRD